MGIPKPVHALDGHCSIVHDNTLYVYSPAGFQSLKLEEGAEWKTEPMDISLTGAQCVKAVPGGDSNAAKLFIVGGSVNETAATWDYPGLMHYTFADKKWDWVRAESWVTQNRQNHAATYLSDSQQLLVYAGSQTTGNVGPSSETFLISTLPPFVVQASPSAGAPPSVMPMLMDVDSSRALMVGGGATNTAVYTFSTTEGWRDLGVALQQPITNQATVQCAVVKGDDGSLVLEQFDLGVSPNKVSRVLLLDQNGNVAQPGTTIGDKTKRVTVSDWPAYNETFAPTVLRNGYSIAQDNNGLTVVTGGNAEEPISVFDSQANSWVNTTELFSGEQVRLQSSQSSATSSIPASTASATPSSTPTETAAAPVTAPASNNNNKDRMLTVLGATLGTIFGIAAILILLLFCLKYKKSKRKNGQQSGYIEKDRLSFADRGAEFMKEAGGSVSGGYARNNDSVTSLAIFNGNGNSGHRRNMASDASTAGLVKKPSPLGYSDPVELSKFDLKPEPVQVVRQNSGRVPPTSKIADRSRSSGWSRYFANNEATNLANIPADRSTFASDRSSGISQSNYTNTRMFNHPSQTVPPLDIPRLDGQRLSHVASGSPTLGNSRENLPHQLHQPMQAELGRANSNGSSRSGISHDDYYLRKPVDSWTPVGDDERPPSSNYTNSMVFADNHKGDGTSSYYPDNTSSFYPKSNFSSFYPGQGKLDIRDSTNTMFPTSTSGGTPEMPKYPFGDLNPPSPQLGVPQNVGRESTATVFPPSNPAQTAAYGEEMSKSKFSSMYPAPPRLDGPVRGSGVTIFPGPNAPPAQAGEIGQGGLSSFYPSPPRVGHDSSVTVFPGQAGQPQGGKQQDMSWLNLGGAK